MVKAKFFQNAGQPQLFCGMYSQVLNPCSTGTNQLQTVDIHLFKGSGRDIYFNAAIGQDLCRIVLGIFL